MEPIKITQLCRHCMRGSHVFTIDLNCYNDDGVLTITKQQIMDRFSFQCQFCRQCSPLDFYRFSHPDMIRYLKKQQKNYSIMRQALDQLYTLFNNLAR